MKYSFLCLIIVLLASSLSAQDTWVQTYRPFQRSNWTDRYDVEDVIVTQDSGYVVSGSFELFGYDPWEYENWGFLMKTDSDGNLLWAVKDSVDFMLYNGYYLDFTELPDGSLLSIGGQGYGGVRYMIKRDSDGNRQWAIPYNTEIGVFSMRTTTDGNVILAGRSDYNAALSKITPDGETIWTNVIYTGSSIARSVCEASDDGFLLTGTNYENDDVLVIKTDEYGDSLWTRTFTGLGEFDKGYCITETFDEHIIVGGYYEAPSPIYGYGLLAYLNSVGDTIWTKLIPATTFSPALSVICETDDFSVFGGCYGESKLIKLNYNNDIILEEDIFGFRPVGDKCFEKITDGFIFTSRETSYSHSVALIKSDDYGNVTSTNNHYLPHSVSTLHNYPNPFNPRTSIEFSIQNESNINLSIFNIKGQLVKTLAHKDFQEGSYSIIWNGYDNSGKSVSSGIYYYKLKVNGKTEAVNKCLLLK